MKIPASLLPQCRAPPVPALPRYRSRSHRWRGSASSSASCASHRNPSVPTLGT
ncbi:hypothetical protein Nmel_015767 [Mimus melanotis]